MLDRFGLMAGLAVTFNIIQEACCRVGYSDKDGDSDMVTCNGTNGVEYKCTVGHCCGAACCTLYYDLWWVWLVLAMMVLISCCCIYRKRQKQLELRLRRRRNRRRNRGLYNGVCNYPGPPSDENVLGYCKLPLYNDVIRMPPSSSPPPPYSSRRRSIHTIACLKPNDNGETMMTIVPCNITSSMLSLASLSHYIPDLLAQNSIPTVLPPSNRDCEFVQTDDNNNFVANFAGTQESVSEEKVVPCSTVEASLSLENELDSSPQKISQQRLCEEGCSYAPSRGESLKNQDMNFLSLDDSSSDDDVWPLAANINRTS